MGLSSWKNYKNMRLQTVILTSSYNILTYTNLYFKTQKLLTGKNSWALQSIIAIYNYYLNQKMTIYLNERKRRGKRRKEIKPFRCQLWWQNIGKKSLIFNLKLGSMRTRMPLPMLILLLRISRLNIKFYPKIVCGPWCNTIFSRLL